MVLPLDDLPLSKVAKQAFLGHQLVVSTLLHDASLVEDEDANSRPIVSVCSSYRPKQIHDRFHA